MRTWGLGIVVLCAACGSRGGGEGDGWPLTEETGPTGVEVADGDFAWSELAPPEPDGGFYRVEHGADDSLWLVGRNAARWDGSSFDTWDLDAAGAPEGGVHYADTLAVVAPDDVWACGTALWHFDGSAWTERTALTGDAAIASPTPVESNRCEVATDGTSTFVYMNYQLFAVEGDALVRQPPPTDGSGAPLYLSSIAVIDGEIHSVSELALDPTAWERVGDTFYSVGRDEFSEGAFCVSQATWPDYATCVGSNLAMDELSWIGGYLDANEADGILVTGLAHGDTADGWVAVEGRLEWGELDEDTEVEEPATGTVEPMPFGFLVRAADGEAHVLPDRFYNLEMYRLAEVGGDLLVVTGGGAVLRGVAR